MKEAMLYEKREGGVVRCNLCAHRCVIKPGDYGTCAVRLNDDGTLVSEVYGQAISAAVDPIEKKPLYHFLPGSKSFSIATVGCNFRCLYCQNADISQAPVQGTKWAKWAQYLPPEEVVAQAKRAQCASISYTYTEPTIFFEYALDCALLAEKEGIKNVFVTNGYMTADALDAIDGTLHAANVDLKGSDEFYKTLCSARQKPVLESIAKMKELGVWVEVTTLIIPGYNDSDDDLREIALFIASVDGDIPWHVSRFGPRHKMMDVFPTPPDAIHRAVEIGYESGLKYVYSGNMPGDRYEDTVCPVCGAVTIKRYGYRIDNRLVNGRFCAGCGAELPVVDK